jgi:hypothetical protein
LKIEDLSAQGLLAMALTLLPLVKGSTKVAAREIHGEWPVWIKNTNGDRYFLCNAMERLTPWSAVLFNFGGAVSQHLFKSI